MRLRERFCAWQVRGNVSQILERAFFFVPGKTLQVQPLHPPSAPLLTVAQISSQQSCQLQRECLFFSHSLWGRHPGNVSPTELRPVKFCFPTILSASWHQTGPADVTAGGFDANTRCLGLPDVPAPSRALESCVTWRWAEGKLSGRHDLSRKEAGGGEDGGGGVQGAAAVRVPRRG